MFGHFDVDNQTGDSVLRSGVYLGCVCPDFNISCGNFVKKNHTARDTKSEPVCVAQCKNTCLTKQSPGFPP
jgi:hypothetical protein